MEEQQLSVDDDLLPIYYVRPDIETDTLLRVCQEHKAQASVFPFLNHDAKTHEMSSQHPHKDQVDTKESGCISGTNAENCCRGQAYSEPQRDVQLDPQAPFLYKSTNMKTQVNSSSKNISAQDVFLASLLQAQLCVMDLQDEIDHSENCTTRRMQESRPHIEVDALVDEELPTLEEDQESDDASYSEVEVEDESLFCDNPLFRNSTTSCPVVESTQQCITTCDLAEANGSQQLPTQDVWEIKILGTRTDVWHQMTREESLEELQIYEDEWEEKWALSENSRTNKWLVSDTQHSTQKDVLRRTEETQKSMTALNSTASATETSATQEAAHEDEGLLFSDSSFWTKLLIEDEKPEQKNPPPQAFLDNMCTPQETGGDIVFMQCPERDMPIENHEEGEAHLVCQGCQGKEHVAGRVPMQGKAEEMDARPPEIVIDLSDDVSTDLETSGSEEATYVEAVARSQDVEAVRCLALKLFHLDGFDRSQVAPYLQKNNDFSALVAEEYLALFDFTGKSLDMALRSLLQELVLTGETQERERVLFHFSKRFHSCNPKDYRSADAVHTMTCALMLLNSDLHGQNIGRSMTLPEFINNLDGMNDGSNFPRELLKGLYNSIRTEKLEWAVNEERLPNTRLTRPESLMSVRKRSNPFVDIPAPDPDAPVYKQGVLCRKVHADADGKKTPWGKRGWKSFHAVLKGMLLFLLKDEYRSDFHFPEEVISVHHSLAERASEYTKRPNVFRLQTADWRVFLFQTQTPEEMNSWMIRINLVAAMFSSPPFPAAVGSQRRFYRPILPSAACKLDLEEQLQSHESLMDRFTDDLTEHQRNLPDSKSKTREWEDYHLRGDYLRFEKLRYETYVKLLVLRMENGCEDLQALESRLTEPDGEHESSGLKRSYSSPSLNPESSAMEVKVKRNISERRTYRRIIPKRNKNLV
ncbi:PH and SEC7 domain-containing protein 4-like [Bufo bufo]|uniref:PH and SEC7 domain-containing protein 4-like n=1 Tax=Bufo bufo TaxID=8384 RepID=UPI001ABEB2CE|nr:PH and SEC7 domain-containing protein 4-like [Bufo bufo]XP_040270550.1 PH and SEC7 domain-containing protein 4-like [Bufo bufo]XP_040270551.1 PH and SEC7 domain-containing protein 4-like [Bufo bufo]XP_040270552.1 PH and SEC7 domain-containing protein 4-like [Bufo bufo]XP_040270553.1 PH and SEC7 domain-containing protein 4-like [Bufo bufo]